MSLFGFLFVCETEGCSLNDVLMTAYTILI